MLRNQAMWNTVAGYMTDIASSKEQYEKKGKLKEEEQRERKVKGGG